MRKPGKVFIIIALCMIVFGTTLAAIAGAVIWGAGASWNTGWYNDIDVYDAQAQFHELDSVTALELTLVNEPVYIVRGGDKVTIEWSQRYDTQYTLSAKEGGALSLSRIPDSGWRFGWFSIGNVGWLNRPWRSDVEDGSHRPVTIVIPEGMDLNRIELNGVNIRVEMNNIGAKWIEARGVNAVINFYHDDISDYNFETSGVNSSLRVDGKSRGRAAIGGSRVRHDGAARTVSVTGVNAELGVWQN